MTILAARPQENLLSVGRLVPVDNLLGSCLHVRPVNMDWSEQFESPHVIQAVIDDESYRDVLDRKEPLEREVVAARGYYRSLLSHYRDPERTARPHVPEWEAGDAPRPNDVADELYTVEAWLGDKERELHLAEKDLRSTVYCHPFDDLPRNLQHAVDGPAMNFFYPTSINANEDTEVIRQRALAIMHLPLCLVEVYDETFALALTGGGMDFSWEIAEAYMRLGFLPPTFLDLPRMAGKPNTPLNRWILDGVLLSAKQAYNRAQGRLQNVLETSNGLLQEKGVL